MAFYFAWVDKTDTAFSAIEHAREDEKVFGFKVVHSEGDFPTLELELLNPNIGLLAPTRKQWAWLSWDHNGIVEPLFFGRLVGVPKEMAGRIVSLTFIQRPVDYEEQKEAVAEALRVSPWYDPVWLSPEDQRDPDRVLEGYTKLWHVDRLTGEVSASDIITGEDGVFSFEDDEVFYDSMSVSYSESPARKVIVEGTVNWTQRGSGSVDITRKLIDKFIEGNIDGLRGIDDQPIMSDGMVAVVAGDQLIANWPEKGAAFGGNWTVGTSWAKVIGEPPTDPILLGGEMVYNTVKTWSTFPDAQLRVVMQTIFDRSAGIVVQIIDHNDYGQFFTNNVVGHAEAEILWIPVWRIAPHLEVNWSTERARSETVSFELEADVQPLLTDPGEAEVVRMSLGPADVDEYIGDARRKRYYSTTNGQRSVHNLIARARAILYNRARAVDVSFEVPFEIATQLSCRMSGSVADARIPGGLAAGKIKAYAFSADGDRGELVGSVVLGCTVGRDGAVTAVPGDPDYCVADYVGSDYQDYNSAVTLPLGSSVGYTLASSYPINDDGVNLFSVTRSAYLQGIEIEGTLDSQKDEIYKFPRPAHSMEVIDRANSFTTNVTVRMKPIRNTAFDSTVLPTLTTLKVPRTIDLEDT